MHDVILRIFFSIVSVYICRVRVVDLEFALFSNFGQNNMMSCLFGGLFRLLNCESVSQYCEYVSIDSSLNSLLFGSVGSTETDSYITITIYTFSYMNYHSTTLLYLLL